MPQVYRNPSPRRCRRKCMEGAPLRSTRLLPRGNCRMASLGYCQSESYPTFHFPVLPLPSMNWRAASSKLGRLSHHICMPCFVLRLPASCPPALLSYHHPDLSKRVSGRLVEQGRCSTVERRGNCEASKGNVTSAAHPRSA